MKSILYIPKLVAFVCTEANVFWLETLLGLRLKIDDEVAHLARLLRCLIEPFSPPIFLVLGASLCGWH